jgi:hypothetical protein
MEFLKQNFNYTEIPTDSRRLSSPQTAPGPSAISGGVQGSRLPFH